jgi:ectoine hydroxylase-related dioxygenase (phytanoyl-CoA dioxygenase family)
MFNQSELDHYKEHGYVIIENALDTFGLGRVQTAYEHIQSLTEPAWRQSLVEGNFKGGYGNGPDAHTMDSIYQYDNLWLDIAANPRILPLLKEIVGIDVQTMEMVTHCHHAGTQAHTGWHRDWPAWSHPQYTLKAKVFYFLDDQEPDMGCFTLVPGTQKLDDGPPRGQYVHDTLEDMPGLKKIVGKAGSAIVWNVLCWHTGLANTSQRDRRIAIYGYMPFWVKKYGSERPHQSIIDWADTPHKRQLMGIHAVEGRAVWDRKDVEYLPEHLELVKSKKF